jgi:toxoflavin biosynthesis protein ToxD
MTTLPTMIDVSGGQVQVGLLVANVDKVLARWAHLDLERSWIFKECPRHEVILPDYSIGMYLVTNREYLEFLNARASQAIEHMSELVERELGDHPVTLSDPREADEYVAWLRRTTGRRFRLPTEAEWEYAAAGPEGLEFPWGHKWRVGLANTAELDLGNTTPVGGFPAGVSPFGILDMAGNVEEFVEDMYAAYPGAPTVEIDDLERVGRYRVTRGGSFLLHGDLCRCSRRHGQSAVVASAFGFRLAESRSTT